MFFGDVETTIERLLSLGSNIFIVCWFIQIHDKRQNLRPHDF